MERNQIEYTAVEQVNRVLGTGNIKEIKNNLWLPIMTYS